MPATPVPDQPLGRRSFLQRSAYFIGGAAAAVPLSALAANAAHAQTGPVTAGPLGLHLDESLQLADNGGYGPLQPSNLGEELYLPEGFTAKTLSPRGTTMSNGVPVPGAHDGMACFGMPDGTLRLVRNHETSGGSPFGANAYDTHLGGTTTVVFDPEGDGVELSTHPSVTGLIRPCGGGPTPWGSWLACEETTATTDKPHGYVFEVPAAADTPVDPVPLVAMGRFNHEAVAVDPRSGDVYETEDTGNSGIYRFRPTEPGNLAAGGELQMLKVVGVDGYDTRTGQAVGSSLAVEWVPINDPDPAEAEWTGDNTYREGIARGGATFARGEGAWTGVTTDEDGNVVDVTIWFACTSGGDAGEGQVWAYHPDVADPEHGQLTLVFESPGNHVLGHPDNITVHPVSGVVTVCEDGGGAPIQLAGQGLPGSTNGIPAESTYNEALARRQRVHGVTTDGRIFSFAHQFASEFAGACWSPDGKWFFVNIQGNATTYAITGPWEKGPFGQ
ncbi:MAG: alkaline phosphatase PhoX [Actinomycetota bacterium]